MSRNQNWPAGSHLQWCLAGCRLEAGEEWYAELAVQYHNRLWQTPVFGDFFPGSAPPLPPMDLTDLEYAPLSAAAPAAMTDVLLL